MAATVENSGGDFLVKARAGTWPLILALAFQPACATLGGESDQGKLTITQTSEDAFAPVEFEAQEGTANYGWLNQANVAEWVVCRPKGQAKGAALVVHSDRAGYDRAKFCAGWVGQTFLNQKLAVVMVNRPGYGGSTGQVDYCGGQSQAAVAAAVSQAKAEASTGAVIGAWGYETGATCAALIARKLGGFRFLILGGGLYDYEDTAEKTRDSYLKKDIDQIRKTGGNQAVEDRSIAYDVSGLPAAIAIYHGQQDGAVPAAQAKSFSDSLESHGGYKVTLQILDGVSHDIPWAHHRKILEVLTVSIAGRL